MCFSHTVTLPPPRIARYSVSCAGAVDARGANIPPQGWPARCGVRSRAREFVVLCAGAQRWGLSRLVSQAAPSRRCDAQAWPVLRVQPGQRRPRPEAPGSGQGCDTAHAKTGTIVCVCVCVCQLVLNLSLPVLINFLLSRSCRLSSSVS